MEIKNYTAVDMNKITTDNIWKLYDTYKECIELKRDLLLLNTGNSTKDIVRFMNLVDLYNKVTKERNDFNIELAKRKYNELYKDRVLDVVIDDVNEIVKVYSEANCTKDDYSNHSEKYTKITPVIFPLMTGNTRVLTGIGTREKHTISNLGFNSTVFNILINRLPMITIDNVEYLDLRSLPISANKVGFEKTVNQAMLYLNTHFDTEKEYRVRDGWKDAMGLTVELTDKGEKLLRVLVNKDVTNAMIKTYSNLMIFKHRTWVYNGVEHSEITNIKHSAKMYALSKVEESYYEFLKDNDYDIDHAVTYFKDRQQLLKECMVLFDINRNFGYYGSKVKPTSEVIQYTWEMLKLYIQQRKNKAINEATVQLEIGLMRLLEVANSWKDRILTRYIVSMVLKGKISVPEYVTEDHILQFDIVEQSISETSLRALLKQIKNGEEVQGYTDDFEDEEDILDDIDGDDDDISDEEEELTE